MSVQWACMRGDLCMSDLHWSLVKDGFERIPQVLLGRRYKGNVTRFEKNHVYMISGVWEDSKAAPSRGNPLYLAKSVHEAWDSLHNDYLSSHEAIEDAIRDDVPEFKESLVVIDAWRKAKCDIFPYHIATNYTIDALHRHLQEKLHEKSITNIKPDNLLIGLAGIEMMTYWDRLNELLEYVDNHPDIRSKAERLDWYQTPSVIGPHEAEYMNIYKAFIEEFAHLGPLEIALPHWGDEPSQPLNAVIDTIKTGELPKGYIQRQENAHIREQTTENVLQRLPETEREAFLMDLNTTQKFLVLRENEHFLLARGMYRLRKLLLNVGSKLYTDGDIESQEDIFFATREELDGIERVREVLPKRRTGFYLNLEEIPPATIEDDDISVPPKSYIQGTGANLGKRRGKVRVLKSVKAYDDMRPGEVLVTPKAAPEIHLMSRSVSGIVTDTGGVCSHAMNFAREYNIPAVVATGNATSVLKDGMMVWVDSDEGTVTIEEE